MISRRDRFTEAYSLYYPLVFSVIKTKVSNIDDARDVCQEVFFSFFEKFDQVENHRKWLYGALRLAVFEYYRKKDSNADIDEVFNDVSLTFVNGFRDARIIIAEAIEAMNNLGSEKSRALFDLVAVYNYSYTEAGKQLGLTKRQVEYQYRQIVERIVDHLKKKGIDNLEDLL